MTQIIEDCRRERPEELARLLGQERFDFAPKRLVIAAGFSQESLALVLIPLEDGVVDPLDPLPAAGLHDGMIRPDAPPGGVASF